MVQKIPHILHQTWKTADIPGDLSEFRQSWLRHHPDWATYFWTDFDNHEFIRKYYSWFLPVYEAYPEAIMRADAVRYFILYHYGGVYADLDYECLRPVEPLLEGKNLVLGLEPEKHLEFDHAAKRGITELLCNAFMASIPGHAFWEHVFKQLVAYHSFPGVLDATGPFLLTRAYNTFPNAKEISIESEKLLYPITSETPWLELPEATRGQVSQVAYGVHHWRGMWWKLEQITGRPGNIFAWQSAKGREVNKFNINISRYLAILAEQGIYPTVSCLMITHDRPELACKSVDYFRRQTYPKRELVILDDGEDTTLETHIRDLRDDTIRFIRLEPAGMTLGELRNLAVQHASGEFIAQWDDDDISDPLRLEIQMAAITLNQCDACLLNRHMIWWPENNRLIVSNERHWESSFICRREQLPEYPILRKGEDTPVIEQIFSQSRVVIIDYPQLYTYLYHGGNTFDSNHWEQYWNTATQVFEDDQYTLMLLDISHKLGKDLAQEYGKIARQASPSKRPLEQKGMDQPAHEKPLPVRQQVDQPAKVLVLVPVKDAAGYIHQFVENILKLTYPHHLISLAFLESDSSDNTLEEIHRTLPELQAEFNRVEVHKRDYGYIQNGSRWDTHRQFIRRSILARSRNYLLSGALQDEDWVLWLDVDVLRYPADIIEAFLSSKKDIVVPNCLGFGTEATYDLNTFKLKPDASNVDWRPYIVDGILQPPPGVGRWYLNDLALFDVVELDGVGSAMLFVRADLHREGLVFPSFSYDGYIESEGLARMAMDMGYRCFGLPGVKIYHPVGSG